MGADQTFFLDHLPSRQVGTKGLGAAANSAQRADQVLLAERRAMQPYLAHGEVLPEVQVISTTGKASSSLDGRFGRGLSEMFKHRLRPCEPRRSVLFSRPEA